MIRWQSQEKGRTALSQSCAVLQKTDGWVTPVVSLVGNSNSGKTTLLEKVVRELKLRGYRVAVIKHSHHDFDIDQPGKDSWRLTQAGSDIVVISSPVKLALFERVTKDTPLEQIAALLTDKVDIILTEGYKHSNAAKILIADTEQYQEQLYREEEILATVSTRSSAPGIPQFNFDDVTSIVNLLVEQIGDHSLHKLGDVSKAVDLIPEQDAYQAAKLEELLAEAAALHGHLCPGQVLGVRMAMRGCQELGISRPKEDTKRLVTYVEIDRCATDAIQVVTGCKLGKRTMKYVDYGKLAATFVDLYSGNAVRVAAREDAREKAALYHRHEWTKHDAEVAAYTAMPDEELFTVERVLVHIPVEDMPGAPLRRVICDECGEEINDYREVSTAGKVLCRSCAYGRYYQRLGTRQLMDIGRTSR